MSIEIQPNQDLILLCAPMRYMPVGMPNGLAIVHNMALAAGLKVQTIDLNVKWYHEYHRKRLDGDGKGLVTPGGYQMMVDPWDWLGDAEWDKPEVLDYFRTDIDAVITALVATRPKMIGFTVSRTSRMVSCEIARNTKRQIPETVILAGGFDCVDHTVGPRVFPYFDYMCIGEAETSFPALALFVLSGKQKRNLAGVVASNDTLPWEPAPLLMDLDFFDFPRYQWMDFKDYASYTGNQIVPLISSRGCRWARCHFCCERFNWRQRRPEKIVEEIEYAIQHGVNQFEFWDSDMNGDPAATIAMCDLIINKGFKIRFGGQTRVIKQGDRAFYDKLARAGCYNLIVACDGWTDHTLRLMNKGYSLTMLKENLHNAHAAGIKTMVNIVFGLPGETEKDIDDSIAAILECKDWIDSFRNLNSLILGAGSDYYCHPEEYGIAFKGDKASLYKTYASHIPGEFWYSENPYIDLKVRLARLKRIYEAIAAAGVKIGSYAEWQGKTVSEPRW